MAYNKNYNGGRNNNGYRNGNYNKRQYRDDYREFERRDRTTDDDMIELNVRRFKKKDIKIVDMTGRVYIIDGNFAHEYILQTAAFKEEAEELGKRMKEDNVDLETAKAMYDLNKECCLILLNHNINGDEYTMKDVNRGFGDVQALGYLMTNINKLAEEEAKKANKANKTNKVE